MLCAGLCLFCCLCVNGTGVTDTSGSHCHADWWQKQFWLVWLLDVSCLDTVGITGNLSLFFISWILYPFALKPQSLRGQTYLFSFDISQGWWVLFYFFRVSHILPFFLLPKSSWVSGIGLPRRTLNILQLTICNTFEAIPFMICYQISSSLHSTTIMIGVRVCHLSVFWRRRVGHEDMREFCPTGRVRGKPTMLLASEGWWGEWVG